MVGALARCRAALSLAYFVPENDWNSTVAPMTATLRLSALASRDFRTPRHTTHYVQCGPAHGPLIIFFTVGPASV